MPQVQSLMTAMAVVEKPEAVKRHLAHAGRPPVPRHRRTGLRHDDALAARFSGSEDALVRVFEAALAVTPGQYR